MGNKIMQETTPLVECSAFHRGMSVLEASLRNTEDSETIISGLLKGAAEFYGASRASVVEADWDLGIGIITYEWCKDGVPAQRDMDIKTLQYVMGHSDVGVTLNVYTHASYDCAAEQMAKIIDFKGLAAPEPQRKSG